MTSPAIVSGGYFAARIGVYRQLPVEWTIYDLAAYAWASNCSSVMVLDGWSAERIGRHVDLPVEVKELGHPPFQWALKRRTTRGDFPEVMVTSVECQTGSPFEDVGPRVALRALELFERRTGTAWGSTVTATAERLIIDSWKGKRSFLEHRPMVAPIERDVIASAELPYTWARDLFEEEAGRAWVHMFDVNAQHLYEWKATRLPYGDLTHVTRPHTFNPTTPGLWRVPELANDSRGIFRTDLPSLLHGVVNRGQVTPGAEWFTTWTLTEAASRGVSLPDVSESVTWASSHAWLAGAGATLEEVRARVELDKRIAEQRTEREDADAEEMLTALETWEAAHLVGTMAKRIYQTQTGMFAAASEAGSSIFHRPVWWAYIVGAARVRLYRKMDTWRQPPFAVLTDAVMFATDEPDPAAFALANGLEVSAEVGAFSHRQTAPLEEATSAAAEAIAGGMWAPGAWARAVALHKIDRKEAVS